MITLFYVIALIFSVILHEIAHGYVALMLGDDTAKRAGRLTLNPLVHIDLFGSIIFPLMLALVGAPIFGWAKPVPYDPRFLKDPKKASGLIALAGPASNLAIAVIFAIVFRIGVSLGGDSIGGISPTLESFLIFVSMIIRVNVALAFFNLLPIPPLDGSGVLFSFFPRSWQGLQSLLERYGFIILIVIVMSGATILGPLIENVYRLLIGL
jgi:Zn-dependent protease